MGARHVSVNNEAEGTTHNTNKNKITKCIIDEPCARLEVEVYTKTRDTYNFNGSGVCAFKCVTRQYSY